MYKRKSISVSGGFTLLELLIVIAIIGIIAAIAIPNYERYVLRSHRVEARNTLQDIAQKLQQNYSISRDYAKDASGNAIDNSTISGWGLDKSPASGTTRYNISFAQGPSSSGYVLQAEPQGVQTKDECQTFQIDQRGSKTAAGKSVRDELSIKCWSS